MPVVPTLSAPRIDPSAFRAPFRGPATSNLAFGGGEARALEVRSRIASNEAFTSREEAQAHQRDAAIAFKAADTFSRVAQEEAQRQANLEALRAKDRLGQFEREVEESVLARRGADAEGSTAEVEERMRALEVEVLEQSSRGTRPVLQEMVINARRDLLGKVSRHERKEREGIEQVLHETNIGHAIDRFTSAGVHEDGAVTESHLAQMETDVRMHTRALGRLRGLPDEVTERAIEQSISKAHRARVERLVGDGQGMLAKRYMEQNADAFTEADEAAIEAQVRKASVDQEAQDFADSVAGLSFGDAIDRARSIKDEDLRTSVISKVRLNHAIAEERRSIAERAILEAAWRKAHDPGGGSLTPSEMRLLSSSPGALSKWEEVRARIRNGLPAVSDRRKVSQWYDLTQEQRAGIDAETFWKEWVPHLDPGDIERFDADRRAAREAKVKPPVAINAITSKSQAAEQMVLRLLDKNAGTSTSGLPAARQEERLRIMRMLDDEVVAWQQANPTRQLDATTLPGIIATVERSFVRKDALFGSDLSAVGDLSVKDVEDVEVPLARIPEAERAQVVSEYNAAGKALSDSEVERAVALYRVMATTRNRAVYDAAAAQAKALGGGG